jgi:SAM-dependent methyltransferase
VTNTDDYVLADQEHDPEQQRLAMLEATSDPVTRERLGRIGVGPGWRCLDVGAGRGSVARVLSDLVGSTGEVVAADLDLRFLTDLPPNVSVRSFDLREPESDLGRFDLVHCRSLLMHLPDPEAAVQAMFALVAPGGWLLVEEYDYALTWHSGTGDDAFLNDLYRRELDALQATGSVDVYFGRKLAALFASLGLEHEQHDTRTDRARQGDPHITWLQLNAPAFRPAFVALGLDPADLDRQEKLLTAPDLVLSSMANMGRWGRRP